MVSATSAFVARYGSAISCGRYLPVAFTPPKSRSFAARLRIGGEDVHVVELIHRENDVEVRDVPRGDARRAVRLQRDAERARSLLRTGVGGLAVARVRPRRCDGDARNTRRRELCAQKFRRGRAAHDVAVTHEQHRRDGTRQLYQALGPRPAEAFASRTPRAGPAGSVRDGLRRGEQRSRA